MRRGHYQWDPHTGENGTTAANIVGHTDWGIAFLPNPFPCKKLIVIELFSLSSHRELQVQVDQGPQCKHRYTETDRKWGLALNALVQETTF